MPAGRVVKWDRQKGYGFIAPDDGRRDVFMHTGDLQPEYSAADVAEGIRVEYSLGVNDRGPKAAEIRLLGDCPGPVLPAPRLTEAQWRSELESLSAQLIDAHLAWARRQGWI